jgi:hypothetical protein
MPFWCANTIIKTVEVLPRLFFEMSEEVVLSQLRQQEFPKKIR